MEDIERMQREAERRVRRMQEHSRRVFEEHQHPAAQSGREPSVPPLTSPGLYAPVQERVPAPPWARPWPGMADERPAQRPDESVPSVRGEQKPRPAGPGMDAEQLLLLGLAILLLQSGCRPELAVALLYIAM